MAFDIRIAGTDVHFPCAAGQNILDAQQFDDIETQKFFMRVVFTAADFGFTDPNDSPANSLLAVKITTLPGVGTLFLDSDGPGGAAPVAVSAGQFISLADINAGIATPETVNPATLAAGVLRRMTIPLPDVSLSPAVDQIVNLPSWLWISNWAPLTGSATSPNATRT